MYRRGIDSVGGIAGRRRGWNQVKRFHVYMGTCLIRGGGSFFSFRICSSILIDELTVTSLNLELLILSVSR